MAAGGPSTAGDDREARLGRRSVTMTSCGLVAPGSGKVLGLLRNKQSRGRGGRCVGG